MSQVGRGWRTVERGKSWGKEFDPNEATCLTEWAKIEGLPGELMKEDFPIGRWGGQKERSGREVEQLAAGGHLVLDMTVGQEAEVADADES